MINRISLARQERNRNKPFFSQAANLGVHPCELLSYYEVDVEKCTSTRRDVGQRPSIATFLRRYNDESIRFLSGDSRQWPSSKAARLKLAWLIDSKTYHSS